MGLFGTLFGSQKSTETIISGVSNGLDAVVFTKEEKAEYIKSILFKLQEQWLPRAISRRLIAIPFTIVFCVYLVVALIFACAGRKDVIELIVNIVVALRFGWIMITIIIFYFGYYGFMGILGAKKPGGK